MKKTFIPILLLLTALVLTGCVESVDSVERSKGMAITNPDSIPVGFDAYNLRATSITRSGLPGVVTIDSLKKSAAEGGGFGVFAYYTDLRQYDQTYIPNFMYNQGVFWNETLGIWEYDPIMYWPNEYGFDASSDDEDHLSFFAYAPYVPVKSAAGGTVEDATYGIIGFSRNNATGDPLVRYIASFDPAKSVDLCWGVCDQDSWARIQGGSVQTMSAGFPWLNVERPLETASQTGASTASRIKFKFNHALAQLNVQIDTDVDIIEHKDGTAGSDPDPADSLGSATKVYVRSISFTGVALQGALNLNNTKKNEALWLDYCGCTDMSFGQSVTIYDGRRDTREGVDGAEAPNETPQSLNPDIVQNSTSTPGVLPTYQNLFKPYSANPLEDAVCVIPTGEAMTITIVYDIETANPNLASYLSDGVTHGVSIENKVTKTVAFGGVAGAGLESNKRYTLKLHLGMNSVKFDAEVGDWADSTVDGDAWGPANQLDIYLNQTTASLGAADTGSIPSPAPAMLRAPHRANGTGTQSVTLTANTLTGEPISSWTITPNATDEPNGPTLAVSSGALANNTCVVTSGTAVGKYTVSALLASGLKASCAVTVNEVTTSKDTIYVGVNKEATITASVNSPVSEKVAWYTAASSSQLTIDKDTTTSSYITQTRDATNKVKGKAAGTYKVFAKLTSSNDLDTIHVKVVNFSLTPRVKGLHIGSVTRDTTKLTLTGNTKGENITFSVSAVDGATGSVPVVSGSGTTASPYIVKAQSGSKGKFKVTATGDDTGVTTTCYVYVNDLALNTSDFASGAPSTVHTTKDIDTLWIGVNKTKNLSTIKNTYSEPVSWTYSYTGITSNQHTGCSIDATNTSGASQTNKLTAGSGVGYVKLTLTGDSSGIDTTYIVAVNKIALKYRYVLQDYYPTSPTTYTMTPKSAPTTGLTIMELWKDKMMVAEVTNPDNTNTVSEVITWKAYDGATGPTDMSSQFNFLNAASGDKYKVNTVVQPKTGSGTLTTGTDYRVKASLSSGASDSIKVKVKKQEQKMNALYFVDTYNVTGAVGSAVRGSSDSDNYFYTYPNAITVANNISGYHLPSQEEWFSIVPADWSASEQSVIGGGTTLYAASSNRTNTVKFRYNTTTQAGVSELSYWIDNATSDASGHAIRYAIRYLGTDYCSLWRYELAGTNGTDNSYHLKIQAILIDYLPDATEAAEWYAVYRKTTAEATTSNPSTALDNVLSGSLTPGTFSQEARSFFARGNASGTASSAAGYAGTRGHYWSSSPDGSNGWFLGFYSVGAAVNTNPQTLGYSVRLFRD